jgi:GNAT superfamily N-acetyltransferase
MDSNLLPRYTFTQLDPSDAAEGLALAELAGWNQDISAWRMVLTWGQGGCFGFRHQGMLVATATTIRYEPEKGWIGMVLTHPDHRGQGLGTAVSRAALFHLQSHDVKHVLLDATAMGRPIYEHLGFRPLHRIEIWQGEARRQSTQLARQAVAADYGRITALDAMSFGATRPQLIRGLLNEFPDLAWVEGHPGHLDGFALAQLNHAGSAHVGPWYHRDVGGAAILLRTALNALADRQIRVDIPEHNTAARAEAAQVGLSQVRDCLRMVNGPSPLPQALITREYGVGMLATG